MIVTSIFYIVRNLLLLLVYAILSDHHLAYIYFVCRVNVRVRGWYWRSCFLLGERNFVLVIKETFINIDDRCYSVTIQVNIMLIAEIGLLYLVVPITTKRWRHVTSHLSRDRECSLYSTEYRVIIYLYSTKWPHFAQIALEFSLSEELF